MHIDGANSTPGWFMRGNFDFLPDALNACTFVFIWSRPDVSLYY